MLRTRLFWLLWPFTTLAVAINLFLGALIFTFIGWPALAPVTALLWSLPLGLPANWLVTRWVAGLIAQAER